MTDATDRRMVPDLPHGCGSWVATAPDGSVREFFDRQSAGIAAIRGWRVETALAYLGRINKARDQEVQP